MHLALGIPLAFYGLYRFLVTQKWRPLWIAVAGFLLTALSSLYYAVILALGLTTFALIYLLLHWRGWRWATLGKPRGDESSVHRSSSFSFSIRSGRVSTFRWRWSVFFDLSDLSNDIHSTPVYQVSRFSVL